MRKLTFGVVLLLAGCSASMPEPTVSAERRPPSVDFVDTSPSEGGGSPREAPSGEAAIPALQQRPTFHERFATAAVDFLASGALDGPRGRRSMNCTGLVQACFDVLGCDERPTGSTRDLHAWCVAQERMTDTPEPGDLVFFDDTWDRDRDGRRDDPLTHVGVVVDLLTGGRLRFVHVGSRKLKAGFLHEGRPGDKRDEDGNTLNSPLRVRRKRDPGGTRYLAGQLLRGFCRPIPCDGDAQNGPVISSRHRITGGR